MTIRLPDLSFLSFSLFNYRMIWYTNIVIYVFITKTVMKARATFISAIKKRLIWKTLIQ